MLGACFGCDDKKDKCDLDCVMPKPKQDSEMAWPLSTPETGASRTLFARCTPPRDLRRFASLPHSLSPSPQTLNIHHAEDMSANCLSLCTEKRSKCTDDEVTVACKACMVSCATVLDGAMLECVQAQDATTTMTYAANLDACMNLAGDAMDACRSSCDDTDKYFFGWTPATEDGTDTTGDVTDLLTLKRKYQNLKKAGAEPKDSGKGQGSSGLKAKKAEAAVKGDAADVARKGAAAAAAAAAAATAASAGAAAELSEGNSAKALSGAAAMMGSRPV